MFTIMVYPESRPYVEFMAWCFLAAFPGMLALEFWQRWDRIWYWERHDVPPRLKQKGIHWSDKIGHWLQWSNELMDRWAIARVERIIAHDQKEAVAEAQRIAEKNCK